MLIADSGPVSRLIAKLRRLFPLDASDIASLCALPMRVERVGRYRQLIREGQAPESCCLLVSGYAARYKDASSGERQIVSFHIAGDLLDIQHLLLGRADHSVGAITSAEVAWLPKADLLRIVWERPSVGKALWKDSLIDASIFREWVLNVGRRDAKSRIAHMLWEFVVRCEAAGLADRHSFELPMTQQEIAEATGLTAVHVNRTLKALDSDCAILRERNQFKVLDWGRLCKIAEFNPSYLHAAASHEGRLLA